MAKCEIMADEGPLGIGMSRCHVHNSALFYDQTHCLVGIIEELTTRIENVEKLCGVTRDLAGPAPGNQANEPSPATTGQ